MIPSAGGRSLSDSIVPPWMWSQYSGLEPARAEFRAARGVHEDVEHSYRVAAAQLSTVTEGAASEAMITAHQRMAVDHGQIQDLLGHLDTGLREAIELQFSLNRALDRIDADGHDEVAAAPPTQRAAIIARRHAQALAVHAEFTSGLTGLHARVQGRVEPIATGILGRGGPPLDTPPDPTQALDGDPQMRGPKKRGESHGDSGGGGGAATDDPVASNPQLRGDLSGGTPTPPQPPRVMPPSPLTNSGISGGGGMGGMSPGGLGGGLGGGGLGSGNPMSGLSSGLGQAPSSAGGGLSSGLSAGGGAPSGMGQPSAAFAQGLSAGSAGGSAVNALPPAAASGASPAPGASAAGGVPAAGLSAGQATAGGIGSSGSHVAPAVSAGTAMGAGSPAMMLPSPGMGAPAAPPAGPPGAAPIPAGSNNAAGSGPAAGTASPGGAGVGAGAVVPAAVMGSANGRATTARIRSESPELVAAKALARQLRRDSDAALYPVIEWVVGVFRSDADQTTETVFMSSEGFGYIPHGVFVPRSARLLAVDPLVDSVFREQWFGWRDPARVLVEYARLRRPGGARLVAAATTYEVVDALREFGVEHAVCAREQPSASPGLDDMHTHRLAVQCPGLYPRVTYLAAWNDTAVLNRLIVPLVIQMIDGVQHGGGGVDYPAELRQMWDALGSGDEIPESAWKEFEIEVLVYYAITSANPGRAGDDDIAMTGGGAVYQAQWLVARTMEVVRGWGHQPPPLADMVYAAAAAYPGDFTAKLDPMLRPLEAEATQTT